MHNFKEYKEQSSGKLLSESQKTETPRVQHIEDVVFNRGFVGAKQTLRLMNSLKERLSGTLLATREETLELSETLLKASRLLSDINSLTLNRISTSETIKNQFKTFTKLKRNHLLDSDISSVFNKWIEQSLNSRILQSKRTDTKRKRQIEKSEILRFYRNNSKDIPLIFQFLSLILDAKNTITKKFKDVKDEDSGVKIDEGYIEIVESNSVYIRLESDKV